MVLESESFLALRTLIGSVVGVQQEVGVETVFVRERLAAVRATMRSFPCNRERPLSVLATANHAHLLIQQA